MTKFVDFAETKDAAAFKDAFEQALSVKVFDALEAKKIEVAQSMFPAMEEEVVAEEKGGFSNADLSVTPHWPEPVHKGKATLPARGATHAEEETCPKCHKDPCECDDDKDHHLDERHLSDAEMKKREDIVKSMKKSAAGFRKRYGERAKSVMYATATKMAKGE